MIRTIIGVAGKFGVGKTTVATHVAAALGFQYIRYSAALEQLAVIHGKRHLSMADLGAWAHDVLGQEAVTTFLIERTTGDVLIDGLRFLEDDDALRSMFGDSYRLIYLAVPESQRRAQWRARTMGTDADFDRRNAHPVEQRVGDLQKRAAIQIGLEDLRAVQTIVLGFVSQCKINDWKADL